MKLFRKITAVLTVILGIAIVVQGMNLMKETADHAVEDNTFRYYQEEALAEDYDVKYASFGADFYTYMYKANDTIVDELDDINKGLVAVKNDMNSAVSTVVRAQNSINAAATASVQATDYLIESVYKVGGMLIAVIGAAVIAYGIQSFGLTFASTQADVPAIKQESASKTAVPAEEENATTEKRIEE